MYWEWDPSLRVEKACNILSSMLRGSVVYEVNILIIQNIF